jgi:hypothetical protein
MRKLMLAAVLALFGLARPADARIIEITTSVSLEVASGAAGDDALHQAIQEVLRQTIAFEPTMVAVTGSRVVGDRLIVRLMIMDEEGERLLRDLTGGSGAEPDRPTGAPVPELRT